jgi:hypothetical protein
VTSDDTAKAKKAPASTVTRTRARATTTSSPAAGAKRTTAKSGAAAGPATRKPATTKTVASKKAATKTAATKTAATRAAAGKATTVRIKSAPPRKKVAAARTGSPRARTTSKVDGGAVVANGMPVFAATSVVPSPRPTPTVSLNGHAPAAPARTRPSAPLWSSRQLMWWGGIVSAAIIACFVAYIISAGKATLSSQAPSLNIAIFSLVVLGAANVWLLVSGRRAVGLRRRALLGEPAMTSRRAAAVSTVAVTSADDSFVADPNLALYHRSDCPLAFGRRWAPLPRATHERAGRTPCGVCRP